jgi:hypothetical protein
MELETIYTGFSVISEFKFFLLGPRNEIES